MDHVPSVKMKYLVSQIFILYVFFLTESSAGALPGLKSCPKGWLQFEKTCYLRQPDSANFEEASKNCKRQEAKLYDFNDSFEFAAIRNLFPDYYFTWIQADVEEELEWLYEPYEEIINGKNAVAKCIAFYSSPTKSYNYWYPCTSRFHSICEKPLDSFHQWMN